MGHRFEIYTMPEIADDVISVVNSYNIDAKIVGRVEAGDQRQLTILTEHGKFEY